MNLENMMWGERSHIQKVTYRLISFTENVRNDQIHTGRKERVAARSWGVGMVGETSLQASTVLLDGKVLCGWLGSNRQYESDECFFSPSVVIITP